LAKDGSEAIIINKKRRNIMLKNFPLKYLRLQRDRLHGKWQIGLIVAGVVGQLAISGPGQCDCGSQTNSNDCGNATPSPVELYGSNGDGGVCQNASGDFAMCEWFDAMGGLPAYCNVTATNSANCPPGSNCVTCQDEMGQVRLQDKKADVNPRKGKSQPK
jgi:hypothetical protein